jgi:hypothetical protein
MTYEQQKRNSFITLSLTCTIIGGLVLVVGVITIIVVIIAVDVIFVVTQL